MVSILAECRPQYGPRYLPIVGRYVDHHSADISNDISADTRPICRPIDQLSVGRYVDRDVDGYIGRGVHKIHMIGQNYTGLALQIKV